MQVSESELDEFIDIYQRTYKKQISRADARLKANNLLMLMKVICRPIGDEKGLYKNK